MSPHSRRSVRRPPTFDSWWDSLPAEKRRSLDPYRTGLLKAFQKPRRSDLKWWFGVGACLVQLCEAGNLPRAPGLIELLADKLEPGRDPDAKTIVTRLYQCRQLAEKCSRQEVDKLARMVRDGKISVQHVTNLLSITDANAKSWSAFLAACVKHNWSANELQRQIQDDKRGGLESRGGRRAVARPTANPAVAARVTANRASALLACHAYFAGHHAPLGKRPQKPTPELLQELAYAYARLSDVSKTVRDAQRILRPMVRGTKVRVRVRV